MKAVVRENEVKANLAASTVRVDLERQIKELRTDLNRAIKASDGQRQRAEAVARSGGGDRCWGGGAVEYRDGCGDQGAGRMSISKECDLYGQHAECDQRNCRCQCHPRHKHPDRSAQFASTYPHAASWRADLNSTDDSEDVA